MRLANGSGRTWKRWTAAEDETLREMWHESSLRQIGLVVGRSPSSVESRGKNLDLPPKTAVGRTPQQAADYRGWYWNADKAKRATKAFAQAMNGHRFEDMPVKRAPLLSNMRLARVREVGA